MKREKLKLSTTDKYLRAAFRKIWRWSKDRRECLKEETCRDCKQVTPKEERRADHVEAVINPKKGWEGWDVYHKRMFSGKLQMLCNKCHKIKTKKENAERRLWRADN